MISSPPCAPRPVGIPITAPLPTSSASHPPKARTSVLVGLLTTSVSTTPVSDRALDVALLRWFSKSFVGPWGRWSLNIDRRRPKAGADDNELALLTAIVAFPVDSPLRDMDEISSYCRDDLRATRSRLQS
jgi:hypothetical protein